MDVHKKRTKTAPQKKSDFAIEELAEIEDKFHDYEFPKVSIVIPTMNCAEKIPLTLESLLCQEYPDYEIVIVDAGSTDRTLEVIKNYRNERIRIYSVSEFHRYSMLNKGISQATGTYINFLFPGDFYLYQASLKYMMALALEHQKPHLAYCGTLIRDGRTEVKLLFRELSLDLLKLGHQPTSLQSCWFSIETFKEIGKFDPDFHLRGAFELMCRFMLNKRLTHISSNRILTDYDLRLVTKRMIFHHFYETYKTLYRYFGTWTTLRWFVHQKDGYRFIKLWLRSVKAAFVGR